MWISRLLDYVFVAEELAVLLLAGGAVVLLLWGKPVLMIYLQVAYCCFSRYFIEQIGLPDAIKYFCDVLALTLFLQLLRRGGQSLYCDMKKPATTFILYTAAVLISSLGNIAVDSSGAPFFVWHIMVYFRYYIFFWACITYLTREDIDRILRFLLALLPVNAALCSFQYFVQGLTYDYNGGIFGILRGCNEPMSMYLFIVVPTLVVWYISGRKGLLYSMSGLALALYISALSELKIMFIVVPVIMLFMVVLVPGTKSVVLAATSVLLLSLSMSLLIYLYPYWADFFTLDSIQSYAVEQSYGGEEAFSRLNAAPYILKNFLGTPAEKLFGIGLGNTWFAFGRTSAFFNENSHLGFSSVFYSLQLIELGLLGLAAYVSFFFAVAADSWRLTRRAAAQYRSYGYISLAVSLLSVALMAYNTTLRKEIAYIYYLALSFPYIVDKEILFSLDADRLSRIGKEARKGETPRWRRRKLV